LSSCVAALAVALVPLAFLHPVQVAGRSMEPGLADGSVRLALRPWCSGRPGRGQVWLVETPAGLSVKRLVGLPGERLALRDGGTLVNGGALPEPYAVRQGAQPEGPWESGPGYFFLGDNRDGSQDSRAWGAQPAASLRGRVLGTR
jgi:signal peptidase I